MSFKDLKFDNPLFEQFMQIFDKTKKIENLSENQTKTISVLRKLAKNDKELRAKLRKRSKELRKVKLPSKQTNVEVTPLFQIPASLPLTVTSEAKELLISLKSNQVTKLQFPKGLQDGGEIHAVKLNSDGTQITEKIVSITTSLNKETFPKFGLRLKNDKNSLNLVLLYPNSPSSIMSANQKHLGDITTSVYGSTIKNLESKSENKTEDDK